MSGTTQAYRPAGPTQALSVVAASHAAVTITLFDNTQANWVSLINTGTVAVAVKVTQSGLAAALPVDGTPGDWVLPPLMPLPMSIPLPNPLSTGPTQITAIGAGAGPSLVYATPIVMQT